MKHYYGYFLFMVCLLISSSSNSIAQEQSNMDEYLLTSSDSVLQQEDGFHKNNYVITNRLSEIIEKEKDLRLKIEGCKKRFEQVNGNRQKENVISKRILKLNGQLADLLYSEAVEKYGVTDLNNDTSLINVGNYIVTKPSGSWWSSWWWKYLNDGWKHAFMFIGKDKNGKWYVIEARGPRKKSWITSWESWKNNYSYSNLSQAMLVNMSLDTTKQQELINYANKYLKNKSYPNEYWLPFSKESMSTFYCSSLVWRAHKSSGASVDLDGDTNTTYNIVYPHDLILYSDGSEKGYAVSW